MKGARSNGISSHILPTSATMVGVCVTVIGIVRLIEMGHTVATIVDNIMAVDSALFLSAALLSYVSIRSPRDEGRLENLADLVFLLGLLIMVVASFMLAWEIGQHPVEIARLPGSQASMLYSRPAWETPSAPRISPASSARGWWSIV